MADVPGGILQLVETFDRNIEAYRAQEYNEAQLRREFIDPFFEQLGWDVTNKQGFAPQYREVIHENSIKIAGDTKAPDYCFRIGGVRKFFLEAKKPAVNIKDDPDPAYQLRRYGWSAKLPLSILTNFETFAVYDCQIRPKHTDRPTTARIINLVYKEYLDKWNEIACIFSKDAIQKGSFDKFAISPRAKRGTTTVDNEFLADIENWRKMLAQIIALRNRSLSIREINFAVQQTVDRILFLRLCEDRGIEPYGQLRTTSSGDRNYPRLCEIFEKADQKYNSGLFHFHDEPGRAEPPDELTLNLNIDDTPIKWILYHLYYPQSPYEFSVLPAEILGNVYEQFLGKVIRLTPAHRAVVEEKPEVKKAGGIYYTPAYIVDYIVKNTVGRLSEGKTPAQISKLKILDPACGSGSFLLGAYTYLLDYHRDWYSKNAPQNWLKKKNPPIYEVTASRHCEERSDEAISNYRLTVSEKKRILLNNIFGVDIDSQAVEVTKLSLLLKVLEGENSQTLENQYRLFHERALPDLGNNIKCGNSLIGPDFFDMIAPSVIASGAKQSLSRHSRETRHELGRGSGNLEELRQKINAFDWQAEFPDIFNRQNPGFDAVIGNPPYVVIGKDSFPQPIADYLLQYEVAEYKTDLFHLFIQRGIKLLAKRALFGYIVPNPWLTQKFTKALRKFILQEASIYELVIFRQLIFPTSNVHTCLLFLRNSSPDPTHQVVIKHPSIVNDTRDILQTTSALVAQQDWLKSADFRFETRLAGGPGNLARKLVTEYPPLDSLARASLGCQAYNRSKHTLRQIADRVFHANKKLSDEYLPELAGSDITRYQVNRKRGTWIKYGPWLHDYRTMDWLQGPRILVREVAGKPTYQIHACYVEETYCNYKTILNVNPSPATRFSMKYLLGILNSKLLSFLYPYMSDKMVALSFPRLTVGDVRKLPVRPIDSGDPDDVNKHDKMVTLVDRMLDLHKQLAAAILLLNEFSV